MLNQWETACKCTGFGRPFYVCHSASGALRGTGRLEGNSLGSIANSRQIGFRRRDRTFNDRAEPIEGAARMLTHLLGMHLIFRKPPSVIWKEIHLNNIQWKK
jgi:hypothetical protein